MVSWRLLHELWCRGCRGRVEWLLGGFGFSWLDSSCMVGVVLCWIVAQVAVRTICEGGGGGGGGRVIKYFGTCHASLSFVHTSLFFWICARKLPTLFAPSCTI